MKKLITLTLITFGILLMYNSDAEAQSNAKLGGGLVFGSEVEAIGIQAGATYGFTEEWSGAADFAIFFPENYDWWTINANVHYKFLAEDNVTVYGLGGLNYATVSIDLGQFGSTSNSEVGLNLGAGAEYGIDFATLYSEIKYVLGDADQLVIGAGLRFDI